MIKEISRKLKTVLYAAVALDIIIIALYESNILLEGGLCSNTADEFITLMAMEAITICAIPLSLRMFKFSAVRRYIMENKEKGLYKMALIRMLMLVLPLLVNTWCYYQYMKASFAYLAIILAISLIFITPTIQRCESEL